MLLARLYPGQLRFTPQSIEEWLDNFLTGMIMFFLNLTKEQVMTWQTPAYTDLRFGFEVTMYIATR